MASTRLLWVCGRRCAGVLVWVWVWVCVGTSVFLCVLVGMLCSVVQLMLPLPAPCCQAGAGEAGRVAQWVGWCQVVQCSMWLRLMKMQHHGFQSLEEICIDDCIGVCAHAGVA